MLDPERRPLGDNQSDYKATIEAFEPYSAELQKVKALATGVREKLGFGDDPEVIQEIEESIGIHVFNEIKDREAGLLLKDIALARNAVLGDSFVAGFELMTQASRLLSDLHDSVPSVNSIEDITLSSVESAIQSGALPCRFDSQDDYFRHFKKYF